MGIISVTLPADGTTADVADVNTPITTIVNAINGNLDSTNISSLSGTKITAGTIPGTALNSALAAGWNAESGTYTYASNNGNKEFTVTTPSDVTGTHSAGMKMSFTRATTAPTQSMSFTAASSQYATKASPTGITFTSAFTCETWVYLYSYTGQFQVLQSKLDAAATTGGWYFALNGTGQLQIQYGAGSSFTNFVSYQSIPLKRWVHVAGVVTSTASKTGAIYINGTLVPSSSPLNAATSLTQAAVDLRIGAFSATPANSYLDGYVSESRTWSVAQSQANIQANMAISLTGSETNLVALFQGNGNFNDKTSNANNLTASGGAIATQAANPYNNIEYGIVTKVSYSAPNTTVTLSTGDFCNIPNMTLNSAQYSTAENPYGLPNDIHAGVGRRLLYIPVNSTQTVTTSAPFAPITSIPFTIPSNVNRIKIKAYNGSVASSAGTLVFQMFNGSTTTANQIGQVNITSANLYLSSETPVSVIPGSTFTLAVLWFSSAGTGTWGASGTSSAIEYSWSVETA